MANALDFNTGYVNAGSPAALDNLFSSTRTFVWLYRGAVPTWTSWASKGAGWDFSADGNRVVQCVVARATTNTDYRILNRNTGTGGIQGTSGTWYWLLLGIDLGGGPSAKVVPYGGSFGSSLAALGDGDRAETEGSGAVTDDSASDLLIGEGVNAPWGSGLAFFGVLSGKVADATAAQAIVDDMAGQSWVLAARMGLSGNGTATDASSNAISLTVSGTTSLITDAPDYWSSGGGGAPRKMVQLLSS